MEEIVIKYANTILKVQLDNGGFGWTVTRKETRIDSSTTATLGYFLVCASEIEEITESCLEGYNKAIKYLMSVTKKNGEVDFSQGDTKDIGVYSILFDILQVPDEPIICPTTIVSFLFTFISPKH